MARRRDLLRLVRFVKPLLGLDAWKIEVQFDEQLEAIAQCSADPEYLQAVVVFRPRAIPKGEALSYVVHELGHCVTWSICHWAETLAAKDKVKLEQCRIEEERLTTTFERIVVNLLKGTRSSKPAP